MALPMRRREHDAVTRSPLAELEQTTRRLAGLVDQVWASGWPTPMLSTLDEFVPPADLEETDDAYLLEVELPGVDKNDLDVEVSGRRLTISGERRERERVGILRRRTRTVGEFLYEVVLPGEIDEDAIKATLAEGVLTVTVPKAASARQQRRRIAVGGYDTSATSPEPVEPGSTITRERLEQIRGARVHTKDGKNIGSVEAVYMDAGTGEPEWAVVNTGWFGHRSSFVPLKDVTFDAGILTVPYDEDTIRRAPTVEPARSISESEEAELYAAYGLPHRPGLHIVSYYDVFPNRKIWPSPHIPPMRS